jgi:hypothetical protein
MQEPNVINVADEVSVADKEVVISRVLKQLKGLSVYDAIKVLYEAERRIKKTTTI